MGVKAIKKTIKQQEARADTFADGDVVRWTLHGYTYAALKTPAGWYTTAKAYNQQVPQTVTFDQLLDILASRHMTDVHVATGDSWQTVVERDDAPVSLGLQPPTAQRNGVELSYDSEGNLTISPWP